ncbi:putative E3 ubiquitin-protein ligase ARI1 [Morella rubra]|uniref:RBR-type E3 ubiquitin transferase n=1 Tax=Morella rubra TaxID=262757 RepID=A0A6A1W5W5_9ROSI|nr:putative E3 ubiquitin-protein ligase ARI1 [Morella rubra]
MDDEYCYYDCDDDRYASDGFLDLETEVRISYAKGPSSEVITKESLLAAQREDLRRIMDVLSLKEHLARTLLIHYRWDVDKVIAVLVEKGKDKLYAEAGVTVLGNDRLPSELPSTVMCIICIEEVPASEVTTMDCGHYFCNNCWTEHFIVKINEGQSRRIRCMAHKCYAICDEVKIRSLVSARDPKLSAKFDRFLLESYIEDNKQVKWCPSVPHCGNAIRIKDDELCEVECACGLQFCFSCLSEAHSPCSCLMWELWTKKCQDESETVNWITVHARPCPKCNKPVVKDGGCNLVCCICGQAFCWLCGGATGKEHTWTSIRGHSCGQYREDQEKKTECAKGDLYRYIHYHNLFKGHTDSFQREADLQETVQEKISQLEGSMSTSKDFSWITNGLNRLFRSRWILAYSYPFAYYMFSNDIFKLQMTKEEQEIRRNLFEEQQQQLHANVEKLSLFLGKPFDRYTEDKLEKLRMKIINLSVMTDGLCRKLYECIENDLLDSIQEAPHSIAPYMSLGLEKASELSIYWENGS